MNAPTWTPQWLNNIFFERNKAGDCFYTELADGSGWGLNGSNLHIAQNHPILTPALLFVSKLFSQADFYMENINTGKKSYKHKTLDMLNNPNYYQTRMDLLESLMFMQIANGVAVLYKKTVIGMPGETSAVYLLDYCKIKWPDGFKTNLSSSNKDNPIGQTHVIYDEGGENLSIKIDDLYFFYDMPNGFKNKQLFKCDSRLDGLKQTLVNTCDSLVAKNIILKTNGKEMITGDKAGFPLSPDEQIEAQKLLNNRYGLSSTRSRSLVTKSALTWKSLHIAIRDLGLDESVKVDGNIIYTALHIPKDILSLEAKKTTYNNFKESMVSYIQNEIQSSLDAFCQVINTSTDDKNWVLKGSYDHLPVMQFIMLERYDVVNKQATALKALRDAGVPDELAIEMCGLPKDTVLKPMVVAPAPGSSSKEYIAPQPNLNIA
jgi:hypothetical protein